MLPNVKYFGIVFDRKLNWKIQTETSAIQLPKSYGILFNTKHYANVSVLRFVLFCSPAQLIQLGKIQ